MISFENINKPDWKYELLHHYVNVVHNYVFYHHYYVLHKERLLKDQPLVVICNHQNGLSDALGILFALRGDSRRPVFIARADIFKREIAAKLLRFLKIMPAFRVQDTGVENLGENEAIFNKSARILLEDGIVGLFPEAGHEDCHHLGTFKKGFARIAFQAAEMSNFEKSIKIQPLAHHYSNYFGMQRQLMIVVGEPFGFEDLYDIYKEHPQRAQKLLAERARVAVKELMLDIEDKSLYEEYDMVRTIYREKYLKKNQLKTKYFPNHLIADKAVVKALDGYRNDNSEGFDKLMKQTHEYIRHVERLHLRDWIFGKKTSVAGFALRFLLAIIVAPFVIVSFLYNFLPYNISSLVTRRIKDPMLHSAFHFVIGALFAYPIWYIITSAILWATTGLWWLVLVNLVVLPLSLVFYQHSKVLWKKVYNRVRRWKFWFRGTTSYVRAGELRAQIVKTMDKLMA